MVSYGTQMEMYMMAIGRTGSQMATVFIQINMAASMVAISVILGLLRVACRGPTVGDPGQVKVYWVIVGYLV